MLPYTRTLTVLTTYFSLGYINRFKAKLVNNGQISLTLTCLNVLKINTFTSSLLSLTHKYLYVQQTNKRAILIVY
jgi:hypothetical protein